MTRQLAMEGALHGIRGNTISPGLILTQQTVRHMEMDRNFEGEATRRMMIKRIGLRSVRIATAVKLTGRLRTTPYELIKSGEIETAKIGWSTFVPYRCLRRWLEVACLRASDHRLYCD